MVDRVFKFLFVCMFVVPTSSYGHHGIGAQFDLSEVIELEGRVERLIWRNPHVRITLGVTNESGNEELWVVEAQSVAMLRQREITEQMFQVGDEITLAGNPARGGATEIYATNVLLPDGREIIFSQSAEPRWNDQALGKTGPRFVSSGDSSAPELGLFRTWSAAPGAGLMRNFDFATHPMTDEARAVGESYDRLTDNLETGECASRGMPTIVGNPYPRDFVDQGDRILMRLEEYDTVRVIHVTDVEPGPPSLLGHSVGEWDEGSLTVVTTRVHAGTFSLGIPLSDELEIHERFTPSSDGSRLDYQVTITDPAVFIEPVELEMYWIYIPGVTVEPYECIEG